MPAAGQIPPAEAATVQKHFGPHGIDEVAPLVIAQLKGLRIPDLTTPNQRSAFEERMNGLCGAPPRFKIATGALQNSTLPRDAMIGPSKPAQGAFLRCGDTVAVTLSNGIPPLVECPYGGTAATAEDCPPQPPPPVTCADGSTVPAGTSCPAPSVICSDGSAAATIYDCPTRPPPPTCPDGSLATKAGCPVTPPPPVACPGGGSAPTLAQCTPPSVTCWDGTTAASGAKCPPRQVRCPGDGSAATSGACSPDVACPGGGTAKTLAACSVVVINCPGGGQATTIDACPVPPWSDWLWIVAAVAAVAAVAGIALRLRALHIARQIAATAVVCGVAVAAVETVDAAPAGALPGVVLLALPASVAAIAPDPLPVVPGQPEKGNGDG